MNARRNPPGRPPANAAARRSAGNPPESTFILSCRSGGCVPRLTVRRHNSLIATRKAQQPADDRLGIIRHRGETQLLPDCRPYGGSRSGPVPRCKAMAGIGRQ